MILVDGLKEKVKKYCQFNKIPYLNGTVPDKHRPEIMLFIKKQHNSDRSRTRRKESFDKMRIGKDLDNILKNRKSKMPEVIIQEKLIKKGVIVVRNFKIGKIVVPLAMPTKKIVINYTDREYHFTQGKLIGDDQKRDAYLAHKGWRVISTNSVDINKLMW